MLLVYEGLCPKDHFCRLHPDHSVPLLPTDLGCLGHVLVCAYVFVYLILQFPAKTTRRLLCASQELLLWLGGMLLLPHTGLRERDRGYLNYREF